MAIAPLVPSGIDDLDQMLDGGWWLGDNVVWVCDDLTPFELARNRFLALDPQVAHHVCVTEGACGHELPEGVSVRRVATSRGPDAVVDALVADPHRTWHRVDVAGMSTMVALWGASAAVDVYRRTCPRLFAQGVVAYWGMPRDIGPAVTDAVGRVAQCVVEVRKGRVRVAKAEGRPRRLEGTTATIGIDADGLHLRGNQMVGRLGQALLRVRRERNLTQAQLAALAGVTPAAISQAEVGHRGLSLETTVRLCEGLAMGLDDLLETSRPPDPLLARHDAGSPSRTHVALLADPAAPSTHLTRLAPGASASPPFTPKGPELILVASGLVQVDVGTSAPVLRAGDALQATQDRVRSIANLADVESTLFWQAVRTAR
jgi:transcriptional regulator with XRE-family HTH domain